MHTTNPTETAIILLLRLFLFLMVVGGSKAESTTEKIVMEGEEAAVGDNRKRYTACLRCTQTCYKTHGISNFNGSCFFKVMLNDYTNKLKIPPKFVEQLKDRMGPDIILEGPSGQLWHAELCCVGTVMTIEHGWKNFASDHAIEFGDFLVFKHSGNSHFIVQIFGRSGCEKQSAFTLKSIDSFLEGQNLNQEKQEDKTKNIQDPNFVETLSSGTKGDTKKHGTNAMDSALLYNITPDHNTQSNVTRKRLSTACLTECAKIQKTDAGPSVKEAQTLNQTLLSYSKIEKKEVKSERKKTESCDWQPHNTHESRMALRVEGVMRKLTRPYFVADMKKSYLYPSFRISVPLSFMRRYLPKDRANGTLLGPDKMKWPVIFPGENELSHSLRGWRDFAVNYNVKLQDICIFELVNKQLLFLKVHLLRDFRCSSRKKRYTERIDFQAPEIEDCKLSSQKVQDRIKVERDLPSDLLSIPHITGYQTELPKDVKYHEKFIKQGCQSQNKLLNGEHFRSTVTMDQKPYFLRGDLHRNMTGPDTAGSYKTRDMPCSSVIILE